MITFLKALVSFGGVGYIKPFSASWGSLAAGAVLFFIWPGLSVQIKLMITVVTFLVGVWCSDKIEKSCHIHDPHFIVIDEVVGMMITCFFLPTIWWQWGIGFVLFRFFDVAKLWPASIYDKRTGGFAVMIDDVFMALLSLGTLEVVLYFI